MAKRAMVHLTSQQQEELVRITQSRTEPVASVQRASILLRYAKGQRISSIAKDMATNRPLVERCIDRALTFGPLQGLRDIPRPGCPPKITEEARAWVLSLACSKPTDYGYAHESWTYSLLLKHVRENHDRLGYFCLAKLGKGRLHTILAKSNIKPHKISYYLERKDPEFDEKMATVLCVYKEVEMLNATDSARSSVTVSYDEKPGIQALKNIAADLMPAPNKHPCMSRDYEYKRLGTVSLLAAIDLHTGEVTSLVRDRHRSKEFVEFLDVLDSKHPKDWKIRMVLDNHAAHISKETQAYLKKHPDRFEFVFTPKHGSWLNLIEVFFSKIARSFLRHIRVQTKEELVERIYRGIEQINQEPVIFRWRYKMDELVIT
jgi:transposase